MTHCDQCSIKFNLLKRKYVCEACQLSHCNDCLRSLPPNSPANSTGSASSTQYQSQTNSFVAGINNFANNLISGSSISSSSRTGNSRGSCRKCRVFMQWPVNVQAVSALRVKDLRFYLSRHNINANTCTEKNELTALVVNQLRKYRNQQQQRQTPNSTNHQQQQSTTSNSSYANSSCYSRHSDHAIPHSATPPSSNVIRDDGIRVQGMNASADTSGRNYYYDSDSIRVFATRSSPVSNRGNDSPPSTAEDDFVLLGHEDLLGPSANNSPTSTVPSTPAAIVQSDKARDTHTDRGIRVTTGEGVAAAASSTSTMPTSTNPSSVSDTTNASALGAGFDRNSRKEAYPSSRQSPQAPQDDTAEGARGLETATATSTPSAASVVGSKTSAKISELDYIKLEALTDESMVRRLTVRQCRVLLAKHRVTTTAIIEKDQLLDRVLTLWRSYNQNKESVEELPDRLLCKICMEAAIDCVLLECSHMVCCTDCGRQLSECPICRQYVVRCVHTFLA